MPLSVNTIYEFLFLSNSSPLFLDQMYVFIHISHTQQDPNARWPVSFWWWLNCINRNRSPCVVLLLRMADVSEWIYAIYENVWWEWERSLEMEVKLRTEQLVSVGRGDKCFLDWHGAWSRNFRRASSELQFKTVETSEKLNTFKQRV